MSTAYDNLDIRYQRIKQKNENIHAQRHDDVLNKAPEMQGLEEERTTLNLERLKCAITDDAQQTKAEIAKKIEQIEKKIEKLLKTHGFSPDYLDPIYTCEKCEDTGYLDPVTKCDCFHRYLLEERIKESGLKPDCGTFETFDLTVFNDQRVGDLPSQRKYMESLKTKVEAFTEQIGKGETHTLILMGFAGTGKTFLAEAVLNRALQNGNIGQYVTANQLFSLFHKHRLGESVDIDLFNDVPVLVIDDLGTEVMTRNVTEAYFYNLVNERLVRNNTTIIATNLIPEKIKERFGDRTYSRLFSKQSQKHLIPVGYMDIRK